jgi:uncharacterized membrane protein
MLIAYAFTRQIEISVGIAIVELLGKTLMYFLFDTMWERWRTTK